MAKENGSNGKEKIEVVVPTELNERLSALAEIEDCSVNSLVRESLERHLDKNDVREVIRSACEKGKLREGSSVCKNIDRD